MTNTQIVPDGEAIRIKRSEALAEIKAHVYTLESTLKTSATQGHVRTTKRWPLLPRINPMTHSIALADKGLET